MGDSFVDEYTSWRTAPDASRLCYQHFIWRELYKSNIHPSIKLERKPDLRIAEFAAGPCLWAMQVAEEFPEAQVVASDIDLRLCPPKTACPENLSIEKWNIFDTVPEGWEGAFDLIHARLLVQAFSGHQDLRPVLQKFVSMLKPGGYLQWDEYDYGDSDKAILYLADDPKLVPDPHISHNASTKIYDLIRLGLQWPVEHFAKLSTYYTEAGLVEVQENRTRPPLSVFRAFHEHWYALLAQLLPILQVKGAEVGVDAEQLLLQIKKNAQDDGVFSAHITKFFVGRKPL